MTKVELLELALLASIGLSSPAAAVARTFGVVPEPTSWAMLIAGLGLVRAAARWRFQAQVVA